MPKTIKYFLSIISLAIIILAPAGLVFAQTAAPAIQYVKGAACGASGQGECKETGCNIGYDVDTTGPVGANGVGECGLTNNGMPLTCCVPTYCGSNKAGIGKCVSGTSCSGTMQNIGNTSDCLPPNICCVIPAAQNPTNTNQTTTVLPTSGESNAFTGEIQTSQTAPEGKTGGLVPCNGLDCSLCDLLTLIKNIINFLTGLVFALAAGFVVWGAVEIMTSGGNESKVTSGRGRITTAVFGIAIALGAWLFIGTLLQVLTNSPSPLPWSTIQCSSAGLQLKPYTTGGSDSACKALGGTCQDKSATCASGIWKPGQCLSKSSDNYQCCMPVKTSTCLSGRGVCSKDQPTDATYKSVDNASSQCPSGMTCWEEFDATGLQP